MKREKAAALSLTALPLHTCLAVGGGPADAIPVAAAWRALHLAAKLLDDVEDGDEIILEDQIIPPPVAVNLGTGFIAMANIALMEWGCDDSCDKALRTLLGTEFNHIILQMATGQHADITRRGYSDLEDYRRVMASKSGNFFLLGAWAGARWSTEDEDALAQLEAFGYNLGMMLQLNDDLKDFRQMGMDGDVASGRYTFPVFYALSVASPLEKEHLRALLSKAATDSKAEKEAKALVRILGGEVYLLAETMRYRRRAMTALDAIQTPKERRRELSRYLAQLSLQSNLNGNGG